MPALPPAQLFSAVAPPVRHQPREPIGHGAPRVVIDGVPSVDARAAATQVAARRRAAPIGELPPISLPTENATGSRKWRWAAIAAGAVVGTAALAAAGAVAIVSVTSKFPAKDRAAPAASTSASASVVKAAAPWTISSSALPVASASAAPVASAQASAAPASTVMVPCTIWIADAKPANPCPQGTLPIKPGSNQGLKPVAGQPVAQAAAPVAVAPPVAAAPAATVAPPPAQPAVTSAETKSDGLPLAAQAPAIAETVQITETWPQPADKVPGGLASVDCRARKGRKHWSKDMMAENYVGQSGALVACVHKTHQKFQVLPDEQTVPIEKLGYLNCEAPKKPAILIQNGERVAGCRVPFKAVDLTP
ncbi:MAG: hypothetical protein WDO70_08270 [Alphaproteobacteria bacterium]